jgi:hypothetical protein
MGTKVVELDFEVRLYVEVVCIDPIARGGIAGGAPSSCRLKNPFCTKQP